MKNEMLPNPFVQQYSYEVESRARLMTFYKEEMAYDKSRLMELLTDNDSDEALAMAERFQEELMARERIIGYLWEELKQQAQLLDEEFYMDDDTSAELERVQNKLRRECQQAEELFARTKNEFLQKLNTFL
jgi:hypothetical protein